MFSSHLYLLPILFSFIKLVTENSNASNGQALQRQTNNKTNQLCFLSEWNDND